MGPGARLGRYEVVGELARGGMGRVLIAVDPAIGREVAVKVPLDAPADPEATARFVAEGRITGQLEHPHIVPVYDVGTTEDGRVFYVMKRVDGRGLDAVIAAGEPGWGRHRLLGAFLSVCAAVGYAHHRGVVHQDLKPQNILLGAFDEVFVLDWGLATLTRAGLRVHGPAGAVSGLDGTPGFIAPERIRRPTDAPTALADQWSLGAVLYTILCGKPPYEGATDRALIDATLAGPPEDVRLRDPDGDVPHELGDICHRALDPAPEGRFADVGELATAVRAFLEGSERRRRALEHVAAADALAPRVAARRAEARATLDRARVALADAKPYDPVERKAPAWALQDEAAAVLREAALDEVAWEQRLQGALQLVPDLHEAHVRLARHHRDALERAEEARDANAAARAEALLRAHDRGHHRRFLAGTGSLTVVTDPPGAVVTAHPFVRVDRRLVPGEGRVLGRSPLVDVPLAPGSWLLTLVHPDRLPVRYPVHLPRAARWDGAPPGASEPLPIVLPAPGALRPDEAYVPAGWFLAGGDPEAPDGLSRRAVWVDGFLLQRAPVTNRAYADWLNRLLEAGRAADAERCEPRKVIHPTHPLDGAPLFGRDADGRYTAPADADPARWARLPVTGIDLFGARRYAADAGARLPDELEREKAARGVDGRRYPWGDHHDPAFACCVVSQALPQVVPVDAFPLDESVYGITGLAGNVRDLCGNRWTEAGPAAHGERLVHHPAELDVDYVSARGGAWSANASQARAATRFGDPPHTRYSVRGVRLARSFG